MLDLAFCCDCTGSMSSYIKSAQENILAISSDIHARRGQQCSIRFALVKYRDHPPQDSTFVTETFAFTTNIETMKKNVDTMAASGGGDGPEAVTAALHEVNNLEWRPNATKVCVLISDAPPHGLGEDGDGFPQGCPLGYDPVVICKDMAAKGIVVYAVGVEPVLSTSYKFARDFMMMVAKITDGKFLALGKASILSEVIVSGALEGMDLKEVWTKMEEEVKAQAKSCGIDLPEAEAIAEAEKRIAAARPTTTKLEVDTPYMEGYDFANCDAMMKATNLAQAQQALKPTLNASAAGKCQSYAWEAQKAAVSTSAMDSMQMNRAAAHRKKEAKTWSYDK